LQARRAFPATYKFDQLDETNKQDDARKCTARTQTYTSPPRG
jgi:hypothetical protein